jgi:hypothetical protein
MNPFKPTRIAIVTLALALVWITGCGHLGASYAPAVPSSNRGIVYVYRPAQHRGSAVTVKVMFSDESQPSPEPRTVGMLENNGYVPLIAIGKTRILFPYANKSVDLNVEAGKSYYVRLATAPGMFDPPQNGTLVPVEEAAARGEIADTKLQEDAYTGR